jgi:hypothetical protein
MLFAVVFVAVALAAAVTLYLGFALAEMVYGYPLGRDLMRRRTARRDEHRFFPGDVRELDDAFGRVARSFSAE